MYVWYIALPFLLCLPSPLQSCRKKPTNYKNIVRQNPPSYDDEYARLVKIAKSMRGKNFNHYNTSWFNILPNTANWEEWGDTFKKTYDNLVTAISTMDPNSTIVKNRLPLPSWWDARGPGYSGFDESVPPWAAEPKNIARPSECYEAYLIKGCTPIADLIGTRYYYDPYDNICKSFDYPGCGDSANNFINEDMCRATCVDFDPTNTCAIDSGVVIYDDRYYQDIFYP